MKKILYLMFLLAPWLLLAGCLSDMRSEEIGAAGAGNVKVRVVVPEDLPFDDLADISVQFVNAATGVTYLGKTNSDGFANEEIEYGSYNVIVSHQIEYDGTTYLLNSSLPVVVSEDMADAVNELPVVISYKGSIIFKEIYYYRSRNAQGGNGVSDYYFTIVNNSDHVEYLDGIGVGSHNVFNSGTSTAFNKYWLEGDANSELRDSIPIYGLGFIFPGDGDDYPLNPGEERHIALNAIDWTKEPNAGPYYIDLSDPNKVWALYHSSLTVQKLPAPGVPRLDFYGNATGANPSQFVLSTSSPAMVLYRIQGDPDKTPFENAQAYIADGPTAGKPGHVMGNPPNYPIRATAIFMPKEWLFDGVEIKTNATHVKRLRPEIDNGYILGIGTNYSGHSYVRKVDEAASAAAGRTVYMDTNNSSVDWEVIDHALLSNPK